MQSICESTEFDYSNFIPPELLKIFKEFGIDFFSLIEKISRLPRVEGKLVVVDLDDTLFSRYPQLQIPLLQDNRGAKGDDVIQEIFGGFSGFIDQFYFEKYLTKEIVKIVNNNISMILTAGKSELQYKKIDKIGLNHLPTVVVPRSYMKPIALLEYIANKISYIPEGGLEIYDDRCEYFNLWGDFLSKILNTRIHVNEVELNSHELENIETWTYGGTKQKDLIITPNDFVKIAA